MSVVWYEMWSHYAEFWLLGIWGILLALIRRCVFGKLCREAALGGGSKGKMLRRMTLKFEKSHEVRVEIHDISAFVKKYLYQETCLGIRLGRWRRLPERWAGLILHTGILEGVGLYFLGGGTWRAQALPETAGVLVSVPALPPADRIWAAILAASAVRAAILVLESDSLWERAQNTLLDYAANSLYPRRHHVYEGFGEAASPDGSGETQEQISAAKEPADADRPEILLKKEEKQLFREVLDEFLGSST